MKRLEKNLDREKRALEDKLNDHINHFVTSVGLASSSSKAGSSSQIDLSSVKEIPTLMANFEVMKTKVDHLTPAASTHSGQKTDVAAQVHKLTQKTKGLY